MMRAMQDRADIEAMSYPMRCKWCRRVHDAGHVTVLARYADCSVWECPHCGVKGDDRSTSWGGTFSRVTAEDLDEHECEMRYLRYGATS